MITLRPVGHIHSTLPTRAAAPRQGAEGAPDAWLDVEPALARGLLGIVPGDELVIVTWLHEADRAVLETHPRNDPARPLTGVFTTRSPDRPNPLGLHRVTVGEVAGTRLRVGPIEAIDGTPVVDIKAVLGGRRDAARPSAPATDLEGILAFLKSAERLKATDRSGYTSVGRPESAAEHTWRVCLMALVLAPEFPDVDFARLVRICLVHDLGEAVSGDIPAPEQARRLAADPAAGKAAEERRDLETLLASLPDARRAEILALWDEYEAAATPEARLAKALDKLETILQHTQGRNPPDFDYRFNLEYGRRYTADHPVVVELRRMLDDATERRARAAEGDG